MRWLGFVCLLAFSSAAFAVDLDAPARYTLHAVVEPAQGSIAVQGAMAIPIEAGAREIRFGLHRTFSIRALQIGGMAAAFSYQPGETKSFAPATRTVVAEVPAGAIKDGFVEVAIRYDGVLEHLPEWGSMPGQAVAMDDQINTNLVQLASYSSWYPQFFPMGHALSYDLEVSLPKGWTTVSAGVKSDVERAGRAVTRWSSPSNIDIVIDASPAYQVVTGRAGATTVAIYYTDMPAAVIAREATDLSAVMALFTERLGETAVPGGTIRHVYAPMKHGQGRAGIARQGIIITSEGRVKEALAANPQASLFQDIAHEIAHFWWHFGKGQGDWVNEAFAEYFSALAVRDIVSPAAFDAALDKYRKGVAGLAPDAPSLASVPANGSGFVVRYYKGSLMLDDFRRSMGDEAFFAAVRRFYTTYKDCSVGTTEFRRYWAEQLKDSARVDAWLDTAGPALR